MLAQAVSWAKAEQTGYWQDGGGVVPGRSPRLDVNDIDRYVETINEHNLAWREWFDTNAIVPVVVSYEDLVADMASTVGYVMHFLGLELPAGHVTEPLTYRQADEVNRDWAERDRAHRSLEF